MATKDEALKNYSEENKELRRDLKKLQRHFRKFIGIKNEQLSALKAKVLQLENHNQSLFEENRKMKKLMNYYGSDNSIIRQSSRESSMVFRSAFANENKELPTEIEGIEEQLDNKLTIDVDEGNNRNILLDSFDHMDDLDYENIKESPVLDVKINFSSSDSRMTFGDKNSPIQKEIDRQFYREEMGKEDGSRKEGLTIDTGLNDNNDRVFGTLKFEQRQYVLGQNKAFEFN